MLSSSRSFRWLLAKEWRELLASRAWWIFLLLMGPLVGVAFISAAGTYAELSAGGGAGEAFSPLVGIWAPTFSACELGAVFLLPFVAIRVAGGDRQTGAAKIEMQRRKAALLRTSAKTMVLGAAWAAGMAPSLLAVLLWRSYGGSVALPELASVIAGHLLNAALTIALATVAANVVEHPSTAAILVLAVTVGCWIVSFIAAVHGGIWERLAGYTPAAMVAQFQHGLVQLEAVGVAGVLVLAGLGLGGIWMRSGVATRRRVVESALVCAGATLLALGASSLRPSWDLSENRMNSFSRADEAALRGIGRPLSIEVHLAPEDPRRGELEQKTLSKLRRVMRHLEVRYVSSTSTGLFEQQNEHYGEVRYELAGRSTIVRSVTPESALQAIYALAGVEPPSPAPEEIFRGHPLAAPPRGAALVFYGLWPLGTSVLAFLCGRRRS
ncbi:MAG TPA: hypothetical protein VLT85_02920 [Terriglobales bacterium]|nr:hypothetical protein [Terriglobales bacterium]